MLVGLLSWACCGLPGGSIPLLGLLLLQNMLQLVMDLSRDAADVAVKAFLRGDVGGLLGNHMDRLLNVALRWVSLGVWRG